MIRSARQTHWQYHGPFYRRQPGDAIETPEESGLEKMIRVHTQMYDDEARRQWVEKRLRAWWEGRES